MLFQVNVKVWSASFFSIQKERFYDEDYQVFQKLYSGIVSSDLTRAYFKQLKKKGNCRPNMLIRCRKYSCNKENWNIVCKYFDNTHTDQKKRKLDLVSFFLSKMI